MKVESCDSGAHLKVAHAVGLVDLGADGGVADRHHLLEHHALLQELPVPLALGDLRIVLQSANHVLGQGADLGVNLGNR